MGHDFQRARTDAQREERRASILAAARALLASHRSKDISLSMIAAETGLAKSALLRYYGSREAILLAILLDDFSDWNRDAARALADLPAKDPEALDLAAHALATSTLSRPIMSELLADVASVLEHNVPVEDVLAFKLAIEDASADLRAALARLLGDPSAEELGAAIIGIHSILIHIHVMAHPAPALAEARRLDPRVPRLPAPPVDTCAMLLSALLRGFAHM